MPPLSRMNYGHHYHHHRTIQPAASYSIDVAVDDPTFIAQYKCFMQSDIYNSIPTVRHLAEPPTEEYLVTLPDEPAFTWNVADDHDNTYRYDSPLTPASPETVIRQLHSDAATTQSIQVISSARHDDTDTNLHGLLDRWHNNKPFNAINSFFNPVTYLRLFNIPKVLIRQYGERYFSNYLDYRFNELGCVISGPDVFTAFHDDAPNFVMSQQLFGEKDWLFAQGEKAFDILHPLETRNGGADARCHPIRQIMLLLKAKVPVFRTRMVPGTFLFMRASVKHSVFTHSRSIVPSSSFFFIPMMRDSINGLIWSVKYDVDHHKSLKKRIKILADSCTFMVDQYSELVAAGEKQLLPTFHAKILACLRQLGTHRYMRPDFNTDGIDPKEFSAFLERIRPSCPALRDINRWERILPIGTAKFLTRSTAKRLLHALIKADGSQLLQNIFVSRDRSVQFSDLPLTIQNALYVYRKIRISKNVVAVPIPRVLQHVQSYIIARHEDEKRRSEKLLSRRKAICRRSPLLRLTASRASANAELVAACNDIVKIEKRDDDMVMTRTMAKAATSSSVYGANNQGCSGNGSSPTCSSSSGISLNSNSNNRVSSGSASPPPQKRRCERDRRQSRFYLLS